MKFQAFNPNRCQGFSLRLDITEIDSRGNIMVKYGPEIEAATCFENNSLEFKSEMLLQFTEILLGHDFDCLHDADRHDRIDFSIIGRLDLLMENMRNQGNYIGRILKNFEYYLNYESLSCIHFPEEKVFLMKLTMKERPEVEQFCYEERHCLWLSHLYDSGTSKL